MRSRLGGFLTAAAMVVAACGGGAATATAGEAPSGTGSTAPAEGTDSTVAAPIAVDHAQAAVSDDGRLSIEVGPGSPAVSIEPWVFPEELHPDFAVLGAWEVGPGGTAFDPPAKLTFTEARDGEDVPLVLVLLIDGTTLTVAPRESIDLADGTLTVEAEVPHFSYVVVLEVGSTTVAMMPAHYAGLVGSEFTAMWELRTWSPVLSRALSGVITPGERYELLEVGAVDSTNLAITTAEPFAAGSVAAAGEPEDATLLIYDIDYGYLIFGSSPFRCASPGIGTYGFRLNMDLAPDALAAYLQYMVPGEVAAGPAGPATFFDLVDDRHVIVDLPIRATADCTAPNLLMETAEWICEVLDGAGLQTVACDDPRVPSLVSVELEAMGSDLAIRLQADSPVRIDADWDENQVQLTTPDGMKAYCFTRVYDGEADRRCVYDTGEPVDGLSFESSDDGSEIVIRGACDRYDLDWIAEGCAGEQELSEVMLWLFRGDAENFGQGASTSLVFRRPSF